MRDICIPITHLRDNQVAEVLISVGGIREKHNFIVESFPWDSSVPVEERINVLRNMISVYNKEWELVQIYNPGEHDRFIHVLYRKK